MERVTLAQNISTWPVDQALVLTSCPNLRAVQIDHSTHGNIKLEALTKILQKGQLQHLEELDVGGVFADHQMASCLQAITRLSHLRIIKRFFRQQSLQSLSQYYGSLKQVLSNDAIATTQLSTEPPSSLSGC
ncbi:hypothetical protein CPB97_002732 [Podila verticillata]|nr:hypothetical protein CPB97_002732 [Podila verticillata]